MDKMKPLIDGFPAQIREALSIGQNTKISKSDKPIHNIVIAGLGGSGIGGNLAETLIEDELNVPLIVSKSYDIPSFVNEKTLFIASSFSGNTEETLSAIDQAMNKNAQIVGITSGGKVKEIADQNGYEYITIPGESKCPRANLGYSVIQLLFILNYKGLISNRFIGQLESAVDLIEKDHNNISSYAQSLADQLTNKLPVIYCDNSMFATAKRFQQQINENAKQIAHVNMVPEFNHNELVGWEYPESILNNTAVIFLHTSYDPYRVTKRMEISREIIKEKTSTIIDLEAKGESFLEQNFYLINLVDWASYYLSLRNGVDPFPVKVIDHLKTELSKV